MIMSFVSKKLSKLCSSEKEMVKEYGPACAKKLKQRLNELEAAPNMALIPPFARCHPLTGNHKGKYAIDLEHPKRLLFEPDFEESGLSESGEIILSQIKAIVIIAITDYH